MKHFLQTDAWKQFQESLGRTSVEKSGDGWSYMAFVEKGRFGRRLYSPYGPTADNQDALVEALASLESEGRVLKVHMIRTEPTMIATADLLGDLGYKHISYLNLQPEQTQIIDLERSEDEILADMKQNNRNVWRNHQKKNIAIETSDNPADIDQFLKLIHKVVDRNHYTPHSDAYFRKQAEVLFPLGAAKMFIALVDGKVAATAIAYVDEHTMYYAHAAADDNYRKLSVGTVLVAEMIMQAKRMGLKRFDLYGIAPEGVSDNHPWAGYSRFKKSFGGQSEYYVGAWEKPVKHLPYYVYKGYQKLRSVKRKR